ncbi:uncharacterized protein LOC127705173 isoform X2 [Mytilus californianus]|uniref:uncharacterized protein LOC127705173 isoform X2 n=1 Tax=Mytilus californianus TaxID=6549 RepID=UPI002246E248|nr:uncharacterized protein LOC127705173 isoform X2 [Mytilus californianus]
MSNLTHSITYVVLIPVLTFAFLLFITIKLLVYRSRFCCKCKDAELRNTQRTQISKVFSEYRNTQSRQISTAFAEHRNTQRTDISTVLSDAEHRVTQSRQILTTFSDVKRLNRGTPVTVPADFKHLGVPIKKAANLKDAVDDKPVAWTPPPPPPPPDPPNPHS